MCGNGAIISKTFLVVELPTGLRHIIIIIIIIRIIIIIIIVIVILT